MERGAKALKLEKLVLNTSLKAQLWILLYYVADWSKLIWIFFFICQRGCNTFFSGLFIKIKESIKANIANWSQAFIITVYSIPPKWP